MDDIPSVLDPDELMDLEEPETYDLDEDDDDIADDPSTSPFQHFSSGIPSTASLIMIYLLLLVYGISKNLPEYRLSLKAGKNLSFPFVPFMILLSILVA